MPEVNYTFVPDLRTKFVANDGREFDLPAAWDWIDLPHRGQRVATRGYLTRKECKELWLWLGRVDPVPQRLDIFVNPEDLDRIIKELKP